jgi:putative tryptophan/tyrosine transport system substrate-binding protein
MRRRDFIVGLGSAAAWPLAARAQPVNRTRRIGLLAAGAADDPVTQVRVAIFMQGLQEAGCATVAEKFSGPMNFPG